VLKREAFRSRSIPLLKSGVLYAVVQLDHAILEALAGEQLQGRMAVTALDQWDALSNEDWDHTDNKLVDRLLVKKGGDDLPAAHQPDILAGLLSETVHEWTYGFVHEVYSRWGFRWRWVTRKDNVRILCVELRPHPETHVVGLSAEHLRIDGLHECVHAIETLRCRAGRQPFKIAVGTRDITVRAGPDVDNNFSSLRHDACLRWLSIQKRANLFRRLTAQRSAASRARKLLRVRTTVARGLPAATLC
jgi:hypothetical protein